MGPHDFNTAQPERRRERTALLFLIATLRCWMMMCGSVPFGDPSLPSRTKANDMAVYLWTSRVRPCLSLCLPPPPPFAEDGTPAYRTRVPS